MSCHFVGSIPGCFRKPPLNHWNMGDGPTSWLQVKPAAELPPTSGLTPASPPLAPPVPAGASASATGPVEASAALAPPVPTVPPLDDGLVAPPVPEPPAPPVEISSPPVPVVRGSEAEPQPTRASARIGSAAWYFAALLIVPPLSPRRANAT